VAAPNEPLVSVVTPVHNGEAYLAECIESVLRQTYSNWEYVIVDNCSTDRTGEIARNYAQQDARIRVHATDTFLPLLANWNHALRQISPTSKYCKVVHADDWLFPECLHQMVALAEMNPSVGIIGAYRLEQDHVSLDGLPYPSTIVSGWDICRRHLLDGAHIFGSPTSLLIRADLARQREAFYNEDNLHSDVEVCLELLRFVDFGFVHQVLTFTRRHNESMTSFCQRLNTYVPSWLYMLQKHGKYYMSETEYQEAMREKLRSYYRFLGSSLLRLRKPEFSARRREFWDYHTKALTDLGHPINHARLAGAALIALYNSLLYKLHIR